MTPRERFEDLRTRRYRQLIDAGIDPDWAWEVASFNAAETVLARSHNADNYENSTQVYGVAS